MSQIYTPEYLTSELEVPEEILPFLLATPRLLPGETEDDFFRLFELMASELVPDTQLEWLWTIEVAWLMFEIHRYRRWKDAIIATSRKASLEFALAKTNPEALLMGGMNQIIRAQSRMDAETLRTDPKNSVKLNAQLLAHGYDADAINANAFVQGADSLVTIEKFLTSARRQVMAMVRELRFQREFSRRADEAINRRLAEDRIRATPSELADNTSPA